MTRRTKTMASGMPSDETLMAYADNMLEGEERQRIDALASSNPAMARRIEMFRATTKFAQDALAPLAQEPVPDALLGSIKKKVALASKGQTAEVIPFSSRANGKRLLGSGMFASWRPAAAAACLAAAVAGMLGYLAASSESPPSRAAAGEILPAPVAEILNRSPSGATATLADSQVRMIATFRLADTTLCREFELSGTKTNTVVAIACKQDSTWVNRIVVVTNSNSNFAPASSLAAIESYLAAVDAGAPLTDESEANALRAQ